MQVVHHIFSVIFTLVTIVLFFSHYHNLFIHIYTRDPTYLPSWIHWYYCGSGRVELPRRPSTISLTGSRSRVRFAPPKAIMPTTATLLPPRPPLLRPQRAVIGPGEMRQPIVQFNLPRRVRALRATTRRQLAPCLARTVSWRLTACALNLLLRQPQARRLRYVPHLSKLKRKMTVYLPLDLITSRAT